MLYLNISVGFGRGRVAKAGVWQMRADVVIIGSGPIGSAFARTIIDSSDLTVLMVEAGPKITEPAGRHVRTIADVAEREAAQIASQGPSGFRYDVPDRSPARSDNAGALTARPGTYLVSSDPAARVDGLPAAAESCNVGGMGAHWTCAAPVPGEGERIPFLARELFDDAFAQAGRLLGVTQTAFDDAPLGKEVRAVLAARYDAGRADHRRVQAMPLGIQFDADGERYWTGPDVILGDIERSGRFELLTETVAMRVRVEGSRATGVEVVDRSLGRPSFISAQVVIVCGDSLRTPQLLFASGVRPRALGHYLNDHAQAIVLARLDDQFVPEGARVARDPSRVDPLSGVSWIPYDRDVLPYHVQVMQMDASPIPLGGTEEPWPGSIVGVGTFGAKDLRFEDRVDFSETETDWLGLPAMRLHYELTDQDERTYDGMVEALVEIAGVIGTMIGGGPTRVPPGSSLHYMGTVRMGPTDDGESVCDERSRVWGFDNLYVGGNGVIPTPTACNPTATSVALAVIAARSIVETAGRRRA